ncbi:Helix-turn-helix domain-containing protein [Sinosporangium album]|uniref:Helix-turn-helix domain-containing protein n=1 Tax=Sinosporangium album TaxID=504805 RepID=A0A1G8A417_9ACTN|nr:helix-turn-helix transcriptional regulator [Sinosporangium album]SDH15668.1 Helix-turn-helix domain-containing protein [Sinosporangium album]
MSATRISPPLRRQRLGRILRDLRMASGMTLAEVSDRLGWSRAKLARVEAGQHKPELGDIAAALEFYQVADDLRETCLTLAGQAGARPWWAPYRAVLGDLVSLETEAASIRSWQPMLVEGLLQTEDYARAIVLADLPGVAESEVDLRVRARMARQRLLLGDDPVALSVVMHEDALRVPVGSVGVMRAQLAHLMGVARWPNVTVRVLPRRVGAHAGMGGAFVLLSLMDSPPACFVEGGPKEIITVNQEQVRGYEWRFDHLAASALAIEGSMEMFDIIAREFDAE